jgi:hypothetical protein
MSVSAVGAVGATSVSNIYATYSPYLNGVVRTSDAAQAANINAAADTTSTAAAAAAVAARGDATAATTAAPPFINPAITEIGARIALGESLTPPAGVTPNALLGASAITGSTSTSTTTPLQQALATDATLGTSTNVSNPFAVNPLASATTDSLNANAPVTTTAAAAAQPAPTSAFAQVAYGDAGELIQSYGAVALVTGPQAIAASALVQAITPVIPPAAIVTPVKATGAVA